MQGQHLDRIMDRLVIFELEYWQVTYRKDARLPGNLMVSVKSDQPNLSDLNIKALEEMGKTLATVETLLNRCYNPYKVIFAKLGFSSSYGAHFHAVPISSELLNEIVNHPDYSNEPDGNDALLYVSREYAERSLTEQELKAQNEEVSRLKAAYSDLIKSKT